MSIYIDTSVTPILKSNALTLLAVGADRWRVLRPSGRPAGHLLARQHPAGTQYVAQRFHSTSGQFTTIGTFWDPDDAVQALT